MHAFDYVIVCDVYACIPVSVFHVQYLCALRVCMHMSIEFGAYVFNLLV